MPERRKTVNDCCSGRRRGAERRHSSRYDTDAIPVWVTWQQDGTRGCGQGRLRDLSISGASLLVDESPPAGSRVRIRLETSPSAPPVEGAVVRVTKTRRLLGGPLLVSLRFEGPCPYEFFTSAVFGA